MEPATIGVVLDDVPVDVDVSLAEEDETSGEPDRPSGRSRERPAAVNASAKHAGVYFFCPQLQLCKAQSNASEIEQVAELNEQEQFQYEQLEEPQPDEVHSESASAVVNGTGLPRFQMMHQPSSGKMPLAVGTEDSSLKLAANEIDLDITVAAVGDLEAKQGSLCPEPPPAIECGVLTKDVLSLIRDQAAWLGQGGRVAAEITKIGPVEGSTCNELAVWTAAEHYFYQRDVVHVDAGSISFDGKVTMVESPRKFHMEPPSEYAQTVLQPDEYGYACAESHTNMYKLCPEVLIPATTIAERIIHIRNAEILEELCSAFQRNDELMLVRDVTLKGLRPFRAGLTVHGRLLRDGNVRRRYWSAGESRSKQWRTDQRHGRSYDSLDSFPAGYAEAEDRVRNAEKLSIGDWIVLRAGVSYAELVGTRTINTFVSHWWGQASAEFARVLSRYSSDVSDSQGTEVCTWICTLAMRQHHVDIGTDWKSSPFNLCLEFLAGQHIKSNFAGVLMALDMHATPMTRIWCAFEAFRCKDLGLEMQLYSPEGKLHKGSATPIARQLQHVVGRIDLERAQASNENDRLMILAAMRSGVGVESIHAMLKLQVMDLMTFIGTLAVSADPLSGEPLREVAPLLISSPNCVPNRWLIRLHLSHLSRGISCGQKVITSEQFYDRLEQNKGEHHVVFAADGGGKSTLAKRLVRFAARGNEGFTPVHVPLTEVAKANHSAEQKDMESETMEGFDFFTYVRSGGRKKISTHYKRDLFTEWASQRFGPDSELLTSASRGGRLLLLLDDFNELHSDADVILAWLKLRLTVRKDVTAVLFTRPDGLRANQLALLMNIGFSFHSIAPFTRQQASKFLYSHLAGHPFVDTAVRYAMHYKDLWRNPLLANFLAHYCKNISMAQGTYPILLEGKPVSTVIGNSGINLRTSRYSQQSAFNDPERSMGTSQRISNYSSQTSLSDPHTRAASAYGLTSSSSLLAFRAGAVSVQSVFSSVQFSPSRCRRSVKKSITDTVVIRWIIDQLVKQAAKETKLSTENIYVGMSNIAYENTLKREGSRLITYAQMEEFSELWKMGRSGHIRLLEPSGDGLQFLHLSLQEFLAAEVLMSDFSKYYLARRSDLKEWDTPRRWASGIMVEDKILDNIDDMKRDMGISAQQVARLITYDAVFAKHSRALKYLIYEGYGWYVLEESALTWNFVGLYHFSKRSSSKSIFCDTWLLIILWVVCLVPWVFTILFVLLFGITFMHRFSCRRRRGRHRVLRIARFPLVPLAVVYVWVRALCSCLEKPLRKRGLVVKRNKSFMMTDAVTVTAETWTDKGGLGMLEERIADLENQLTTLKARRKAILDSFAPIFSEELGSGQSVSHHSSSRHDDQDIIDKTMSSMTCSTHSSTHLAAASDEYVSGGADHM